MSEGEQIAGNFRRRPPVFGDGAGPNAIAVCRRDAAVDNLNRQIYGVLTFYSQFHLKPRGRYIIRVCVGTACHVQGAERIVETFFGKLGIGHAETSEDLRFTFEKVACLGACGMAPLAMVNDDTFGKMTVQKVDEIIAEYNQRPMK